MQPGQSLQSSTLRHTRFTILCLLCLPLALLLGACGSPQPPGMASSTQQAQPPSPTTTWVPPTAVEGTPIPGAEATLTAAPALKRGTLRLANNSGQEVTVRVEVADTEPSRQLGLMFRTTMAPDEGMLFDFGGETTGGFWMANTLLPLSIAFIQADGTILNIEDMRPLDTSITAAAGPYHYALEMNQGFFRVHDIQAGNRVFLPVAMDSAEVGPQIPGMPDCPR